MATTTKELFLSLNRKQQSNTTLSTTSQWIYTITPLSHPPPPTYFFFGILDLGRNHRQGLCQAIEGLINRTDYY